MKIKPLHILALICFIGTIFLLSMVKYSHNLHFIVVHFIYINIVLFAMINRKMLFPITIILIIIHLSLDFIDTMTLPLNALLESFMQLFAAYVFFTLLKRIDSSTIRYKNVIDSTRVGTWEWHVQTGECRYSSRWAEIIGYELHEIEPTIQSWLTYAHPDDIHQSNLALESVFSKKDRFYDISLRMKHKKGHWVWIRDCGEVITWNHQGKPLLMVGTHTDITQEKTLQEAVSHSHDLMQYIIHHNQSAIAVHDKDLRYIFVSQKYIDEYDVKDSDIIGKHHYDVFPDLPQKWRDVHQRVLKGEVISADRDIYIRQNGMHDWTRWECRPWYEKDGSIGGIIVYTEIITKHIQREIEIEKTSQMLSTIMDNLPIGIALNSVLPKVVFTYMNDHFPELYGTTRERLMSEESFWDIVYEDEKQRNQIKSKVEKDSQSGDPKQMQWHQIPIVKKGKIIKYVSAYNLPIAHSDLQISLVMDVTEQKMKEEEILNLSYQDFLTGIPNRRYLSVAFDDMEKNMLYPIGLMIMDLNGLKLINDAFGHEKGNQALCQVATVLKEVKREQDVIARIGGDEFTMLLPQINHDFMIQMKDKIESLIETKTIENIHFSLAIGLAIKEDNIFSYQETLRKAEEQMYKKKVLEGRSTRNRAILSILNILTDKFLTEKQHSQRVSDYCYQIGLALKLSKDELEELKMAGMLHDIGKVSVPDEILDKPGKLSSEEWLLMKEHTIHGYNILRAADEYSNLALYALTHHEKIDGTGYPKGLKADEIPLFSRIIAIADAYEAMTSDRPYRKSLSKQQAVSEIVFHAGTQFDERLSRIFIDEVLKDS